MTRIATLSAALAVLAQPALAASGPFFSLGNTNFVVLLAFIVFLLVLVYFKVPVMIGKMLDERASFIQGELDEARKLREDAQGLLASFERKQKDVQEQAEQIITRAKGEAEAAAAQAKEDIAAAVARRLEGAQEQLESARKSAEDEVRNSASNAAVAAARELIAKGTTATVGNKLIDEAIADVEAKLH